MSDNRQFSWWAGEGDAPETYTVQALSREAVIAAAQREFGADVVFSIVEATQDGPFACAPFQGEDCTLIETVIERFAEDNGDRFGEDGFDGYIDPVNLSVHLNKAFAGFMALHGEDVKVWAFTEQRHRETILPEAAAP